MAAPTLSLVIPCYNEAANLPELIARCRRAFAGRSDVEVLLVDNGSTDATADLLAAQPADDPLLRAVRVPVNQGYGFGIVSGLRAARGRHLAWTHADLQTDPADALRALEVAEAEGAPCFVKGFRRGRPPLDRLFSRGMGLYETLLFGRPFDEINAQPTLFPAGFFAAWQDPPDDFSLDLYAYLQAHRRGLAIRRIDVTFPPRKHGQSHWNRSWKDRWKFIRRTVAYSRGLKARLAA